MSPAMLEGSLETLSVGNLSWEDKPHSHHRLGVMGELWRGGYLLEFMSTTGAVGLCWRLVAWPIPPGSAEGRLRCWQGGTSSPPG